ncbi:hypothetical protein SMRU11_00310 (plasmid) [Sinorhizobium meliloti RU11/001]|nr:hypothetical protein SMRU11_00310 [Sinorhizobium meliloti RU11/001]
MVMLGLNAVDVGCQHHGQEIGQLVRTLFQPLARTNLALSARSWDFGQVEERCGNIVSLIDE